MNKQDLIASVGDRTGLSRSEATSAVEAVLDSIGAALKRGDEVRLVGFGTFTVSRRKASTGRNPRTGHADPRFEQPQVPPRQAAQGQPGRLRLPRVRARWTGAARPPKSPPGPGA